MSGVFHRNGWELRFYPEFIEAMLRLERAVKASQLRHPHTFHQRGLAKRLSVIRKLVFEVIPEDPSRPEYRLGATLGVNDKHWFRAKFYQQYRLFFRYHARSRIIVFCWFNDDDSKRAYESDDDAYRTFQRMIARGNPPNDWDELVARSTPSLSGNPD